MEVVNIKEISQDVKVPAAVSPRTKEIPGTRLFTAK